MESYKLFVVTTHNHYHKCNGGEEDKFLTIQRVNTHIRHHKPIQNKMTFITNFCKPNNSNKWLKKKK